MSSTGASPATDGYLWFKIHAERRRVLVLLAARLGYSLPLIFLLRAG